MTKVKLELTLEVPMVQEFCDYHEIDWYAYKHNDMFNLKGNKKLKCLEVDLDELQEIDSTILATMEFFGLVKNPPRKNVKNFLLNTLRRRNYGNGKNSIIFNPHKKCCLSFLF